jgi:hypothetical protein
MRLTKVAWLGAAVAQMLLWQNVPARDPATTVRPAARAFVVALQPAHASASSRPRAHRGNRRKSAEPGASDRYDAGYAAGLRDGKRTATQAPRYRRSVRQYDSGILAIERQTMREQAERAALAERVYRSALVSAPIITDARACKRTGAHGESIYENCQLAGR